MPGFCGDFGKCRLEQREEGCISSQAMCVCDNESLSGDKCEKHVCDDAGDFRKAPGV